MKGGPRRLPMAETTIDFEPRKTRNLATKTKNTTKPSKTIDTAAMTKNRVNKRKVQPETLDAAEAVIAASDAKPAKEKKVKPAKGARGMSALDDAAKVPG